MSGRRREPAISNPASHPRREVILRVAAEYLGLSARTLRARIEAGQLPARRDGRVYRISLDALIAYRLAHMEGIDV